MSSESVSSRANDASKKIYIFRHGETDWNKAGRMQGHADIPLNQTGRDQALELQKYFAQAPVDVFLSSDLKRAKETADIARGNLKVPHVIDPRQRETNLGQAEGLTREEIEQNIGKDALENWTSSDPILWDYRFPNGESKHEHMVRVRDSLIDFLSKTPHQRIGFCSHGGSMRRLIHGLRPDLKDAVVVHNCMLYEFCYEPSKGLWIDKVEPVSMTCRE